MEEVLVIASWTLIDTQLSENSVLVMQTGETHDSSFTTSSQVMLTPLVFWPVFE